MIEPTTFSGLSPLASTPTPVLGTLGGAGFRLNADARPNPTRESQRSFTEVLAIANRAPDAATRGDDPRRAAEDFVAQAMIEPILKQMREATQAPPPWGPGPGEKKFLAIGDAHTAREIARGQGFALVDRLARELRGHVPQQAATSDTAS